jgi:hypothetical protein
MKICNICKKEKDLEFFGKHKKNKDRLNTSCKDCDKIYQKEYRKNNANRLKIKHDKWNYDHKDSMKIYLKEYNKNRYNNDPIFKQNNLLRVAFNSFVKKGYKSTSILNLLGCSSKEFNKYIEQQFQLGMTWKNHGKVWEYDHIKPISKFNMNILEEQEKCWYYTNFMPRFKTTKIAKSFGSNQIGNKNKGNKILIIKYLLLYDIIQIYS